MTLTDLAEFRRIFSEARRIAILTGAGVSAESGVPTFRGAGGYWRKWQAQVRHFYPYNSLSDAWYHKTLFIPFGGFAREISQEFTKTMDVLCKLCLLC